jgi:hypothetical protein
MFLSPEGTIQLGHLDQLPVPENSHSSMADKIDFFVLAYFTRPIK